MPMIHVKHLLKAEINNQQDCLLS